MVDLLFDLFRNVQSAWCTEFCTTQRHTFLNRSNRTSTVQWYTAFKCSLHKVTITKCPTVAA